MVYENNKKFALNLQLQTIQILTNDVQMLILFLSYLITTVFMMLPCTELSKLRDSNDFETKDVGFNYPGKAGQ